MKEPKLLIIVPCFNEENNIDSLLEYLSKTNNGSKNNLIVIADGGSTDQTLKKVTAWEKRKDNIKLLHNPKKTQSTGINLAIKQWGDKFDYLLRVDAHAEYPDNFISALLTDAIKQNADSVVVSMYSNGKSGFQIAAAAAQNSKLGNGGSPHRNLGHQGKWIEHGHHALIRISAFTAVGGYDENFVANEDAELDIRLTKAGYKIWLSGSTNIIYFPRSNINALFKQYQNHGKGRAANALKHRNLPKFRQMIPLSVAPAILLSLLAPLHWVFFIPALSWASACFLIGLSGKSKSSPLHARLSGIAAMCMHMGWSVGFWTVIFNPAQHKKAETTIN